MQIGHGAKFPRKKNQTIIALLTHQTIGEAAQAVGIAESTLWRWTKDQDFQLAYREARNQVVQQATAQMQANMSEAVQTLRNIMNDQNAPASARVSAAKSMIEIGLKAMEIEEIESRLAVLEKQVFEKKESFNQ
jgi:hypothetical protein